MFIAQQIDILSPNWRNMSVKVSKANVD